MPFHPRFTPDFTAHGLLAYLTAVLHSPGRVAANYWARRSQWRLHPALVLGLLVGLTTLVLLLLQTYHEAWAITRQRGPLTPAQVAQLNGRLSFWGIYGNLRQLLLLPLYALPAWLIYRPQGLRYGQTLFVFVLWNTAYNLYSLLLFGLMAAHVVPITTLGVPTGLFLLLPVYLTLIGHRAIGLNWVVAGVKAALTMLLVVGVLRLLGYVGL